MQNPNPIFAPLFTAVLTRAAVGSMGIEGIPKKNLA